MTRHKLMAGTFVLFAALGFGASDLFAVCIEVGGFAIFQCADLAYFDVVPAPFGPDDVTAVFWQVGFGNNSINTGTSSTGTGMTGPTTFNGNDSGLFEVRLYDAYAWIPGAGWPPGSVCLTSRNNWGNSGIDGCSDNPRVDSFYYGGFPYRGDDDMLNPYFGIMRYEYGYPGYYTRAAMMDYPMAVLLETPDGLYFAIAAVTNWDRGNDGSGENGPCAPNPGSNPGPCNYSLGWYNFKDVSNGLPNAIDPGKNNVVPWQSTPEPAIVSSVPVDPGDPNSDLLLDVTWTGATVFSDESVKPSWNPTLAPADPNAAPGVGVLDIASRFGLVRYEVQVAAFTDPNFASLVDRIECPGDTRCTSDTSATFTIPVDTCLWLRTLFGKKPQTTDTTLANCRLGMCGDIGYHVTSPKTCFLASCTPSPEICDAIDNDCDGSIDEDFGVGDVCDGVGECGLGVTECADINTSRCSSDPGGSADQSAEEICDNLDNDCDGIVDQFDTACGFGECASTGTCVNGVDSCTPGAPTAEICDGLDNDCNGVIDNFTTTCGVGACGSTGFCSGGIDSCTPGTPSPEVCDGIDNDCDGAVDEDAIIPEVSSSINPVTLNARARASTFTVSLTIKNVCDPGYPRPLSGDLLERTWLSRAGSISLPDPLTVPCPGPGGDVAFERGIVDNPEDRVTTQGGAALRFNLSSDGDCRTLDGDRQDLLAILSGVPDNTEIPICVAGTVSGIPFESCTTVTVKNR